MINRDGRGHLYCGVRGEILGSSQDKLQRRRLPRMSFINQERQSRGSKDDQIPS